MPGTCIELLDQRLRRFFAGLLWGWTMGLGVNWFSVLENGWKDEMDNVVRCSIGLMEIC